MRRSISPADLQNVGELQLQRIKIPARVLAKPVEREPQHPQFGVVEVGNGHGGDFGQAEPFGGNSQSPTGDHAAVHVDDDGKHEAKLFDARLQLADLCGRVFARLSAERLQRFNADEIWIEIAGYGKAVPAQHWLPVHRVSPSKGPGANPFGPNIITSHECRERTRSTGPPPRGSDDRHNWLCRLGLAAREV